MIPCHHNEQPVAKEVCLLDSTIRSIRASIASVENHPDLYVEANFHDRAEALDFLEFAIDRIEGLLLQDGETETLTNLCCYAENIRTRLEVVDEALFRRLRQEIASGNYTNTGLRERIAEYAGPATPESQAEEGYDALDALVNGLLLEDPAPVSPDQYKPEMIFYQPTPARIVLEMVERADFQPDDLFYDIGSGLGQVAILVHLLTGIRSKGVEIVPAYAEYARRCARRLNLSLVEFIAGDARTANYAEGTVFFLYTPFKGEILAQMLERLRQVSTQRQIRLCTYGPCTLQVARQNWLEPLDPNSAQVNRLALFSGGEQ